MSLMTDAAIALASLPNLRDLGGWPAENGSRTRHGVVYRSEAPALADPDDAAALVDVLGVTDVVDLRLAEETAHRPLPGPLRDRVRYHHVPFAVEVPPHELEQVDMGNGLTAAALGRFYLWMAERNREALHEALTRLAQADGPALVHCAVGKDRTGLTAASALLAVGAPEDAIVADYASSDAPMRAVMPRHDPALGPEDVPHDAGLQAPAEAMRVLLDGLRERLGDPRAYLHEVDPRGSVRAALRQRLLERA